MGDDVYILPRPSRGSPPSAREASRRDRGGFSRFFLLLVFSKRGNSFSKGKLPVETSRQVFFLFVFFPDLRLFFEHIVCIYIYVYIYVYIRDLLFLKRNLRLL